MAKDSDDMSKWVCCWREQSELVKTDPQVKHQLSFLEFLLMMKQSELECQSEARRVRLHDSGWICDIRCRAHLLALAVHFEDADDVLIVREEAHIPSVQMDLLAEGANEADHLHSLKMK